MMGNYNHMLAQHHGLCGPNCMSQIRELYQCWLVHGNRPTILVVDTDRAGSWARAEESVQRQDLKLLFNCTENLKLLRNRVNERKRQTTGWRYRMDLSTSLANKSPIQDELDILGKQTGRRVGIGWLGWRNTVGNNFPASYSYSDVAGAGVGQRPSHPLWLTFVNCGQTCCHSSQPFLFLHTFICKLTKVILFQYMYYVVLYPNWIITINHLWLWAW